MNTISIENADREVEKAKASGGDEVLVFPKRIGATPYIRYTPYWNNRGVKVDSWSAISIHFEALPGKTLRGEPHIVRPDELDDYPLRHFSTEWIKHLTRRSRQVEREPVDETPFGGIFDVIKPTDDKRIR